MIKEHYKHNRHTWLGMLTHVIVLLIVFILPEVVFTTLMDHRPFGARQFVIDANTLIYIITFYINYFFLIDRLLFKRKNIWLYVIVTLIITLAMVALCTFSQQIIHFFFDNSQQFANRDRQDHHHMSRFIGKINFKVINMFVMLFFHKTHICPILLFGNRNERESAVVCRLFNHRHILSIETA